MHALGPGARASIARPPEHTWYRGAFGSSGSARPAERETSLSDGTGFRMSPSSPLTAEIRARITLPAIQYLSVSSGNDNRLKIGEKSPKPIGKGIQIQKNENRQFIVDNRCKPNDLSLRLLKICFGSEKNRKI